MRWPWKRAAEAHAAAEQAEARLAAAQRERKQARDLADHAVSLVRQNGFTAAVRSSMGLEAPR